MIVQERRNSILIILPEMQKHFIKVIMAPNCKELAVSYQIHYPQSYKMLQLIIPTFQYNVFGCYHLMSEILVSAKITQLYNL